jgi:hypothetical protein
MRPSGVERKEKNKMAWYKELLLEHPSIVLCKGLENGGGFWEGKENAPTPSILLLFTIDGSSCQKQKQKDVTEEKNLLVVLPVQQAHHRQSVHDRM